MSTVTPIRPSEPDGTDASDATFSEIQRALQDAQHVLQCACVAIDKADDGETDLLSPGLTAALHASDMLAGALEKLDEWDVRHVHTPKPPKLAPGDEGGAR